MEDLTATQQRPHHRRNASSRSGILRALVPSKSRASSPERESATALRTLGPNQVNVRSPPSSASKSDKHGKKKAGQTPVKDRIVPLRNKSATNLAILFGKANRSSKDLSSLASTKGKENDTPPQTAHATEAPIWAQFTTNSTLNEKVETRTETAKVPVKDAVEPTKEKPKLGMAKAGGKVMSAVAAWQARSSKPSATEQEAAADSPAAIDAQFEAVLAARQIPELMRQKMRTLTTTVKLDFIRQHQGNASPSKPRTSSSEQETPGTVDPDERESEDASTKRSRPRSRTFTFSKGDKRSEGSPTKRQRGLSKTRPTSIHIPQHTGSTTVANPSTPTGSMRKAAPPALPSDYIGYLQQNPDPVKVEVGRLHKLRILLRNETVAWVDDFISQGGMKEVVALIHRIIEMEWREDHEDQLLHKTLLCLKGLCTTDRAISELDSIATKLFPALFGMLFGEEKKGPAEYTTRAVITTIAFNFLSAATTGPANILESRARLILGFLAEVTEEKDVQPLEFVLDMRIPRPYKVWAREISNVTKEVFWIFLHQLNVIPSPKLDPSSDETEHTSYSARHFPSPHPPVPAAPYIGGVEWDATTYVTSHLDLLNGLIASLPTSTDRNHLREELKASGFEKVMGATLRTCKEKFYSGVHDGLRTWVAAAVEDGWGTRFVREGPNEEELLSPKRSPRKPNGKVEAPPKIELNLLLTSDQPAQSLGDDGWLG